MLATILKLLFAFTMFFLFFQFFLFATTRDTYERRREYCLPLGITLFIVAMAGFASHDVIFVSLSIILVCFSLWLGPTTWRGKSPATLLKSDSE